MAGPYHTANASAAQGRGGGSIIIKSWPGRYSSRYPGRGAREAGMDFLPRMLKIQRISEQPPACAWIARSDPPAAGNTSQIIAGQISRVNLHYFAAPKVLMPVPKHPRRATTERVFFIIVYNSQHYSGKEGRKWRIYSS